MTASIRTSVSNLLVLALLAALVAAGCASSPSIAQQRPEKATEAPVEPLPSGNIDPR